MEKIKKEEVLKEILKLLEPLPTAELVRIFAYIKTLFYS